MQFCTVLLLWSGVRPPGACTGDGGENHTNHFWWQGKFYRLEDESGTGEEKPLTSGMESGTVRSSESPEPDIQIGRSLGAKAKNYEILDLQTGEWYEFVEGTALQDVHIFAGKGTKTPYRKAADFATCYGSQASDWQHVKGVGHIAASDGDRMAEVHWSQCEGIGRKEFFIKKWLD